MKFLLLLFCLILGESLYADEEMNWSKIDRWMIELESEFVYKRGLAEGTSLGAKAVRIVGGDAKTGELYYFAGHAENLRQQASKAVVGTDWRNEPFNFKASLKDQVYTAFHVFNRMVKFEHLKAGARVPPVFTNDMFFQFFPVWTCNDHPPPSINKSASLIVYDAINIGNYERKVDYEILLGERCNLFQSPNGVDKIWVATEKPYCVLKRQRVDPKTEKVMSQLSAIEIAEVAPSLWLPIKLDSRTYSRSGDVDLNVTVRLRDWKFGSQVPPDGFQLELPSGTIEKTKKEGQEKYNQISKGGRIEHFERVATFYRDMIGLPINQRSADHKSILRFCGAVFTGMLIGIFFQKFKRRDS